ncbi:MAG: phosphonate C-P lyase system protein PhnK [Deltaproteobacteria bacterium]|jgi:putative phosphonate transport system ATP-binding protein|nr:phosphonate C-P lyase system protein PhnK [Deltaproteobacteria bacterium]
MNEKSILKAQNLTKNYGSQVGCLGVDLEVYPSEILGLVGESGSGKTTVLNLLSGRLKPDCGSVLYSMACGDQIDIHAISEAKRRAISRSELGFVHQNPVNGLNLNVSAGANIAERLLSGGERSYHRARAKAIKWLEKVEISASRLDEKPENYSGGMRQRLQIAKNLVTEPKLVFLDEPTGGLDVSVQARLLDLLRRLQADLGLSAILVTHDLGVARLLSQRLMVMKDGRIIESGLTDRVLDDPQQPYTQLLVSSTLEV